ncbi:MAG: hypothetical protein AAF968_09930 [Pseudomonadota bacterium]
MNSPSRAPLRSIAVNARHPQDIESHWTLRRTLTETGGRLESPSITFGEDSDSVLIENLLASVSQHQRQRNRERTNKRLRACALNSHWCFHALPTYRFERRPGHGEVVVRNEPVATILAEAPEGLVAVGQQIRAKVTRFLQA